MSKVNFTPIGSRILVKPDAIDDKTATGIIIPDAAKQKPNMGEVVAVGPGTHKEPMSLKVGDRILYGQYAGAEIEIEGVTYKLLVESDAYGVI